MDDTIQRSFTPTTAVDYGGEAKTADVPTHLQADRGTFDDIPLNLWQESVGHPYTAEFFNLESFYGDEIFEDIITNIHAVDDFVQRKIQSLELENTKESYKSIIDELVKQIGHYETERPTSFFNRIAVATQAISRLESVKIKPVLTMQNLSVDEFAAINYDEHVD